MIGTVYLVGAGPGDPGLLTLAGRDALAAADIVFYDALVHPALLAHCRREAEKVFVGKRAEKHFVPQGDTNALLVDAARAGKSVVRLKGGDPFVFGRGGEECEYLRAQGIPFIVVPGISSALAAPAYAGIPVTHRDASSSFAVITGHERGDRAGSAARDGGKAEGRRRWDRIAHAADTLIFLMGVEALDEIAARLIENGRSAETPAALVQWGTWPAQKVVVGTLVDIAETAKRAGIAAPAVTVIGDVVRYRESLRWFDSRPLFGKRILLTRARDQASTFAEKLRALGADPIEFPTIAIEDPDDGFAALDAALTPCPSPQPPSSGTLWVSRFGGRGEPEGSFPLPWSERGTSESGERAKAKRSGEGRSGEGRSGEGFHWAVFTSANGVARVFERLAALGRDARWFAGAKVAAIGPATAEALRQRGIIADFVPSAFIAEKVAEEFPEPVDGLAILLLQAAEARDFLPELWRKAGAQVTVVPTYRTVPVVAGAEAIRAQLAAGEIDCVTFTSASTVQNFVAAMGSHVPASVKLFAIGPITAQTCAELLRAPDAVAADHTIDGLIAALKETLG